VIPPGVDANLFRPQHRQAARHRLGVQDKRVLLFVGRMDRIKAVDMLLSATAGLLAAEPQRRLTVLLVGGNRQLRVMDDASREVLRLQTVVRDLSLQQVVRFVGPKEQTELPAYYAAADVCVVPSYAESFGMTAVEAMACGTPVVASRVGGLQSTIVDGVTGFLVPRDHPEDCARRIRQVLDSSELRARLGRAAVRAAGRYQWSTVAKQLAELYSGLGRRPGSMAA
jgi:D-inositol-3-phosphate glycosyltransferase